MQRAPQSLQLREKEDERKGVKDNIMLCHITWGPVRLTLVQMLHLQKQNRKQPRKKREFSAKSEQYSFNNLGAKRGEIYTQKPTK